MDVNETTDLMKKAAESNDPAIRRKARSWKEWAKAPNALDAAEAKLAAARTRDTACAACLSVSESCRLQRPRQRA